MSIKLIEIEGMLCGIRNKYASNSNARCLIKSKKKAKRRIPKIRRLLTGNEC